MREILFRGKQIDIGEWVEGDLQHAPSGAAAISACNDFSMVDPETIGQYTGLNDRNGTKIFEGDIVNCTEYECCGYIAWNESEAGFYCLYTGVKTLAF